MEEGYMYQFNPNACSECGGGCCTGESGYIWLTVGEMEAMAERLTLSVEDFATMYVRKVGHRYSLVEKKLGEENFACIFFDEAKKRCSVYEVRPRQCRTFPFWEQFKRDIDEVVRECPGIVL
jgi:Fe-S-cluster containining protein